MSKATPLPPPRVITTTHSQTGESIFSSDTPSQPFAPYGPAAGLFYTIHATPSIPASNNPSSSSESSSSDSPAEPELKPCPPSGAAFCLIDMAPDLTVPMHRTNTIDYAVVLAGEIVLRLDGGEEKTVRAGECIVQRGVNHQWINRSGEYCRAAVVAVGAERVMLESGDVVGDVVLGEGDLERGG